MKIFIISSEKNNKFGISKVINQLKQKFRKFNKIECSNNIINFVLSKPDILHIHGCWKVKLIIFFLIGIFSNLQTALTWFSNWLMLKALIVRALFFPSEVH